MLKEDTRRQLKEHGWLEIARRHKNPSLALRRLKDQAFEAISDLTLFADKLPAHSLNEIFHENTNFEKLLDSILGNKHPVSLNNREDIERYAIGNTLLASMLVSKGINFCMYQYTNKIERNSVLNEPIVEQLKKATDICYEIAFKMKLSEIRSTEEEEGLFFLFSWNKIKEIHETRVSEVKGEDTRQFIRFVDQERAYAPIEIVHKIASNPYEELATEFEFSDVGGYRLRGRLLGNLNERVAHLSVEEESVQADTLRRDLVIKIENENVTVYQKNEKLHAHKKKR